MIWDIYGRSNVYVYNYLLSTIALGIININANFVEITLINK